MCCSILTCFDTAACQCATSITTNPSPLHHRARLYCSRASPLCSALLQPSFTAVLSSTAAQHHHCAQLHCSRASPLCSALLQPSITLSAAVLPPAETEAAGSTAVPQSQGVKGIKPPMLSVPEEEELQATQVNFNLARSPRGYLRRSASTQPTSNAVKRGSSFSALGHASKLHSSQWARRSAQAAGVNSGQIIARHGSMIRGQAISRQLSMAQGKRLSARALLGAFGPMGLSEVVFDLQGKIDADQLQAAQVCFRHLLGCPLLHTFFCNSSSVPEHCTLMASGYTK